MGLIAAEENRFNQALKIYLAALEISEKNKIYLIKSNILINLGNLHLLQKDTANAMIYYHQNIANAKKNNLSNELSKSYMNIAYLSYYTNDKITLEYYQKALSLAVKNKDYYTEFGIHSNLIDLYLGKKFFNTEKALYHLQKTQKNQEILKDDTLLFLCLF